MNSASERTLALLAALFVCSVIGGAQGVPYSPGALTLGASDVQGAVVPAGSQATLLTFTVEADSTGQNFFDVVVSDPNVAVSLILPSGTEITSSNASSLGFNFTVVPDGTNTTAELPSALSLAGTHTTIQIPPGQVSGTYQVKANATSKMKSTSRGYPNALSRGATPITGATVTRHCECAAGLTPTYCLPITNASPVVDALGNIRQAEQGLNEEIR